MANRLSLNLHKTEYMAVGYRSRLLNPECDSTIQLQGNDIKKVISSNTVGVVDERMTWQNQVEATVKKVSKGIGIMRLL